MRLLLIFSLIVFTSMTHASEVSIIDIKTHEVIKAKSINSNTYHIKNRNLYVRCINTKVYVKMHESDKYNSVRGLLCKVSPK